MFTNTEEKKMKHLVLIGPPGSGKGTLSLSLKNKGFIHISTGDLLREEIASGSTLGQEIAKLIDNGQMVDDVTSLKIMKKAMKKESSGTIFDGYPRNLKQLELLEKELLSGDTSNLYIIYLNMPLEQLAERIINRYICPLCGEIYNLKNKPPIITNDSYLCLKDHAVLEKRKDDNLESLQTRFKVFLEKTAPVIEKYRSYPNFYEIDASQDAESVLKKVERILN